MPSINRLSRKTHHEKPIYLTYERCLLTFMSAMGLPNADQSSQLGRGEVLADSHGKSHKWRVF